MRLFRASEIEHPWRTSLAYLAVTVYATLLIYWVVSGPLMIRLIVWLGRPNTEPTEV